MKPRLFARGRLVVPPLFAVIPFLVLFLMAETVVFTLRAVRPAGGVPPKVELPTMVLFAASVGYGTYRVLAYNPAFRPRYRAWLESTPWTVEKPLPLGPVELIWEDGLVVGALILLGATQPVPLAVYLLGVFLSAHLVALILMFWLMRMSIFAYSTSFALGLAVWCWYQPLACVAALASVYLLAYEGLRRTMARFPWDLRRFATLSDGDIRFELGPPRDRCGWPHDQVLGEVVGLRRFARADALLVSMLASWWLFVLVSLVPDVFDRNSLSIGALCAALLFAPAYRLRVYTRDYQSPLGLWARLLTFRWIIPGYDQVLIGPLCAVAAGPVTAALLRSCMVPLAICCTAATGVVILAAMITPPGLLHWRLTGHHRIVPTPGDNSFGQKQKLIRVK